jgi:hypothetical protein
MGYIFYILGRPLKHNEAKQAAIEHKTEMVITSDTSSRMRVVLIRNNVRLQIKLKRCMRSY